MSHDESKTIIFTEHVHFSEDGQPLFCPPLEEQVQRVVAHGFTNGEIFLRMLPDGTLDSTEAMHLFTKDGKRGYMA